MTLTSIALRTPTSATSSDREQRAADRAEVVHRPLKPVRAPVRAAGRRRRAARCAPAHADPAMTRRQRAGAPTCQTAVVTPISDEKTAVAGSRRARTRRRRRDRRRARRRRDGRRPRPSATPSISPSAAAGAPSVEVRSDGSSAVGTSWPRSARRLAPPIPATPRVSQRASLRSSRCLRPRADPTSLGSGAPS